MEVLVIDIGGSHVKFAVSGKKGRGKFESGNDMTPQAMCSRVVNLTTKWNYDVVSIGFPGPVLHGRAAGDPPNLGQGWVGFDFRKAFKKPVRIMNDAAMQALGSYRGGRMLFLGLGTGIGSALILDDVIVPLELGELRYSRKKTVCEVLGKEALEKFGEERWQEAVDEVIKFLAGAFRTDYVVIGGGNVKKLKKLPKGARRGSNEKAFLGGTRLWSGSSILVKARKHTWVIV